MTGYFCPVEGCDYGKHEEKEQRNVTRHINAKSGEDHADVERLRALVAEQGDDQEGSDDPVDDDPENEGNESPDDSQGDGSATDTGSDDEDNDMANEDEYKQQYQNQDEETDDQGDGQGDDANDSDGFLGALTPSRLSTTTVVMMVAVTLVILYFYVRTRDGSNGGADVEETEPALQEDQMNEPADGFNPVTPAQEGA